MGLLLKMLTNVQVACMTAVKCVGMVLVAISVPAGMATSSVQIIQPVKVSHKTYNKPLN